MNDQRHVGRKYRIAACGQGYNLPFHSQYLGADSFVFDLRPEALRSQLSHTGLFQRSLEFFKGCWLMRLSIFAVVLLQASVQHVALGVAVEAVDHHGLRNRKDMMNVASRSLLILAAADGSFVLSKASPSAPH